MRSVTACRSRRGSSAFIRLVLLMWLTAVLSSCGDGEVRNPVEGDVLSDEATFTFRKEGIPPDRRFVLMLNDVVNDGDEPVVIRRLEPISKPDPQVAILEKLELAPRGKGEEPVEQGTHLTYPPGSTLSGAKRDCVYQDVSHPDGYVLAPSRGTSTRALMVMMIRTTGLGSTSFEVGRIEYEQGGSLYFQDIRLLVELTVTENARPLRPASEEAACMDEPYVIPQPSPT